MVRSLQSLIAYAHPDKTIVAKGIPSQTRAPAIPRWRIPENSVANTNTAIWYAPTSIGQMKREDNSVRTVIISSNYWAAPLLWICITTEITPNDLRWVLLTRENKMSQVLHSP